MESLALRVALQSYVERAHERLQAYGEDAMFWEPAGLHLWKCAVQCLRNHEKEHKDALQKPLD